MIERRGHGLNTIFKNIMYTFQITIDKVEFVSALGHLWMAPWEISDRDKLSKRLKQMYDNLSLFYLCFPQSGFILYWMTLMFIISERNHSSMQLCFK